MENVETERLALGLELLVSDAATLLPLHRPCSRCRSLRLWQSFQASGYVDAIAIDAAFILDHIAKIDAYPVVHLPIRSDLGVPVAHRVLNGNCTFDGIRDA